MWFRHHYDCPYRYESPTLGDARGRPVAAIVAELHGRIREHGNRPENRDG
jgi:hypothetical protein